MNMFFKSILSLSVVSGIASSILNSNSSIKKYVSYFISLIMILIIFSPVFNIVKSFDSIKEYISDFKHSIKTEEIIENSNELIINTSEFKICDGIKEMIITKFGFDTSDVFVTINCDKDNINSIKIKSIDVILTNKASWADVDLVKEYLDKAVGCEINVSRR